MNEKSKPRGQTEPNFSVGGKVYVQFGKKKRLVRIVEDRGRIGREGRRLLRVQFARPDGAAEQVFEIPADEVTRARTQPRRPRISKAKVA
jgi:hypothetical protein